MKPKRSSLHWAMEALALLALIATVLLLAGNWRRLPPIVPIHFGLTGAPNAWGGKDKLWLLSALSAGLYLFLTIAAKHPSSLNIPSGIDREHPEVQSLLLGMATTLKAVVLLDLLALVWLSIQTALGKSDGLGIWFLPVTLMIFLLVSIGYWLKLRRYRREEKT